jgi:GAF domain-containing protein
LIAVPLISQGQTVGVMYVGSFTVHRFDQDEVQFVSSLANQAAVAISNARLFSEIAESRDQLQAILDSAADGLLIFEPTGRIVLVTHAWKRVGCAHGWLNERHYPIWPSPSGYCRETRVHNRNAATPARSDKRRERANLE